MKANDKEVNAFPLVDGKFGSGILVFRELRFWLLFCAAIALARYLGWL